MNKIGQFKDGLFCTWSGPISSEWVDYNGHLRDAFYMLIFSYASDGFMDLIGLDEVARNQSQRTIYTLETHLNYLLEVKQGGQYAVMSQILATDSKRVRLFHNLINLETGVNHATNEQALLHIDQTGPKAAVFNPDVAQKLADFATPQIHMAWPENAGRAITFGQKK